MSATDGFCGAVQAKNQIASAIRARARKTGMRRKEITTRCELCGREKPLTFHHLIPKAMHGKKRFQKRHTKAELRGSGIEICRLCHSGIHDLISERELAEKFTTKAALLEHPAVAKHVAWVTKQK
jgi:hypothetical protein